MKKMSRTTAWRVKKGKSPGIGKAYHNRNKAVVWTNVSLDKAYRFARHYSFVYGIVTNIVDDAAQEICIAWAEGRSAQCGFARAIALDKYVQSRKWKREKMEELYV